MCWKNDYICRLEKKRLFLRKMAVNHKDRKCGCPMVIGFYPLEFEGFRILIEPIKNHLILNEITMMQASAISAEEVE